MFSSNSSKSARPTGVLRWHKFIFLPQTDQDTRKGVFLLSRLALSQIEWRVV
jgi:hypothetical protein